VPAAPPSNPGGAGTPPQGAAGIRRTFNFDPLAPHLLFDAAFLLGEIGPSPLANDFMSVDLDDGTTSWNVFYADSFSSFSLISVLHGLAMTEAARVHVDLRTLFPGVTAGAPIQLTISVGNRGGDVRPSWGYVDSFRFAPAAMAFPRNGSGKNAMRYSSSPPVLGGAWTIQVDTTGHAGARLVQLTGMKRPASGTLRTTGEVLISGTKVYSQSWTATPGINVHTIVMPVDLSLVGTAMSTQVTITGGKGELTNAYDLVLGF